MPNPPADAAPPKAPTSDTRVEAIAALIRNGLSNGPIARFSDTWDHLQTRLGDIARAIVKEL